MCNRCFLMGLDDEGVALAHRAAEQITATQDKTHAEALGIVLSLLKLEEPPVFARPTSKKDTHEHAHP